MEVELSVGTYTLQEPTLPGWSAVLAELSDEDFQAVSDLVYTVLQSTPEQRSSENTEFAGFVRDLSEAAWPILRKSPDVVQRLMEACCEGLEDASGCTATDATRFIQALIASDVFEPLIDLVKNALPAAGEEETE